MELRDRIRDARKTRGMSQEALARGAGVSLSLINQIERGVIADPHYSTLAGIADALGMSVGELLGEPVPLDEAPAGTGRPEEERRFSLSAEELAVLFRGLARRGRWIVEQARDYGASELLRPELQEFHLEGAVLARIKGGRDILGLDPEELAEAVGAYAEVETQVEGLVEQYFLGDETMKAQARLFGKGKGGADTGEQRGANVS